MKFSDGINTKQENIMKKYALIGLLTLLSHHAYATEQSISKDLDGDGKPDHIWLQDDDFHIKLSSQKQVIIQYNPCDEPPNLRTARVGFIVSCNAMRHGRSYHYAYNRSNNQMQVIGYDFWAAGTAANEGAGEDSVNLKTGDYIGKWRLRNNPTEKLRDYTIQTRLPNIQPINVNHPDAQQQWQALWDAIKQEKRRRHLPID